MSDIRTRFNNLDIPKLYDAEDVSAEDKIIVAKLYSEKYLCYVSEYDKES